MVAPSCNDSFEFVNVEETVNTILERDFNQVPDDLIVTFLKNWFQSIYEVSVMLKNRISLISNYKRHKLLQVHY